MIPKLVLRYVRGLKFPWLFAVTAALFCVDLAVPDLVPFADELLLGLATLLLGAWRAKKTSARENSRPERTIAPRSDSDGAYP